MQSFSNIDYCIVFRMAQKVRQHLSYWCLKNRQTGRKKYAKYWSLRTTPVATVQATCTRKGCLH